MSLYRGQPALIDTFNLNGTTTEVRTEAITGGPQRLIALLIVGEGDERWLGPSWSNGKLYFYGDPEAAPTGPPYVVYRFDPAHNAYASARADTYLTGFSVVGERAYEATAPATREPASGVGKRDSHRAACG